MERNVEINATKRKSEVRKNALKTTGKHLWGVLHGQFDI